MHHQILSGANRPWRRIFPPRAHGQRTLDMVSTCWWDPTSIASPVADGGGNYCGGGGLVDRRLCQFVADSEDHARRFKLSPPDDAARCYY